MADHSGPTTSSRIRSDQATCRDFIEERFGQSRHNPDIFYSTTILKSRSVDEKEAQDFINSLNIPRPENPNAFKFVFQHWYPRIWDEWARDKDRVDGYEIEAGPYPDLFQVSLYRYYVLRRFHRCVRP